MKTNDLFKLSVLAWRRENDLIIIPKRQTVLFD